MKSELLYLLLTAILTGLLWIPVVIGYVTARGTLKPENYRVAPTSPLPDWVNRANRAHLGLSTSTTQACAAVFFYARLAHAVIHISGFGLLMARTLAFTLAWVAFMIYAVVLLQRAM